MSDAASKELDSFPDFWSWLPKSITYSGDGVHTVGWFTYYTISYDEEDRLKQHPQLYVHYLTPPKKPIKLLLPHVFFKDKPPGTVNAVDVIATMTKMFQTTGFRGIPPAPPTMPIEKLPPHKRAQLRDALRKRKTL